eukprot:TRINITY_DN39038_c0_g2_i1.p2 TRINITY_DN39038_c0_g2~~TRINITY_DN39038_c0_g2_i1.p2  ORF type:complete len:526 (-),score=69.76 TRINITY_DN39038_c0_g2_i1:514-2091(-)
MYCLTQSTPVVSGRQSTGVKVIARSASSSPQSSSFKSNMHVRTRNNKLSNSSYGLPWTQQSEKEDTIKTHAAVGETAPQVNFVSAMVGLSVFISTMGAFSFGYHLGVVNGPLEAIATDLGIGGNAALKGAVVSSCLAGAAVGSLSGGALADSLGRKMAFILDAIPLIAGCILCATASSLTGIIAGRVLVGVGIGLSSALVPLYIGEMSPTFVRGALGSVNQLFICIGILGALLVNVALPATSWRTMFYFGLIPAGLLAAGMMLFCPESPRFLWSQGEKDTAITIAKKLWGPNYSSELQPAGAADKEVGKMEVEDDKTNYIAKYSKLIFVGCMLFVIQQFSGVNAIVFFSSSVFAQAGIQSQALASAAVGAINIVGTLIATAFMESAGRKQLLSISLACQGLAMVTMAAGLGLEAFSSFSGTIALVGTLAYMFTFALGTGPVPGLLLPEIFPTKVRAIGVSAAMGTHWITNFMVGQLFLQVVEKFGIANVYLGFAAVCALGVLYVQSQLVETKGKSFEEIEKEMMA